LDLDPAIVNVNGGAIAIGHPLGATGPRDFGDQCWEAIRRGVRYFAVGMCVGGGQGMVAIFENVCPGSILSGEIPPTP
jgi:acetyl-CoA acetyltransferase